MRNPLLVILGPTAVGKSDLAVELALKYGGEIISADSRQIYRCLDVGSGKITPDEMQGVPHHCLDIADPEHRLSVAEFKSRADTAICNIHAHGKLPIITGGTGFYIQAVADDIALPDVPPNQQLREKLDTKTVENLYQDLQNKDPERAATIEPHNKRRLIRALEIVHTVGKVPSTGAHSSPYDLLEVGLYLPRDRLCERITHRTQKRLEHGMIEEAQRLHKNGLSLERMREIGLTYYHLANYIAEKITYKELIDAINTSEAQYARKQMSWFRRDKQINWYHPDETKKILSVITKWLQSRM